MKRDPFEIDMSVGASKKRRRTQVAGGARTSEHRQCEHPECNDKAEYRAPKSREQIEDFHWFCLKHVRAYNARWNYFSDLDPEDIEKISRAGHLWDRPTWKLGEKSAHHPYHVHRDGNAWKRQGFEDLGEFLGERSTLNPGKDGNGASRLTEKEQRALSILGLESGISLQVARARFRTLVKTLHPDLNGGDESDSQRLREVLNAWELIKISPRICRR